MSERKTAWILGVTFVIGAAAAVLPFFLASNDKVAWVQAGIAFGGLLFLAVTLDLQRRQIHENTEATREASDLAKRQITLQSQHLRASIRPILTLTPERGMMGEFEVRVENVGKDLTTMRHVHFNNPDFNVSATGFEIFVGEMQKRLDLTDVPIRPVAMPENCVLHPGDRNCFILRLFRAKHKDTSDVAVERDRKDVDRLLKALEGTQVRIGYDNVLDEREPVFEWALHVPTIPPPY